MNDFILAVTSKSKAHTVKAHFMDGSTAIYTMAIIELLKTDKTVDYITDRETGEVIYSKP